MSHRRSAFVAPSECPVCGANVPPKARACPQCGADERTGWNEEATRYDGLDLPANVFDEAETEKNDRGSGERPPSLLIAYVWWGTGLCIILLMIYLVLSGRF